MSRLVVVLVARVLHVGELDAVLLVLHEVEVARENGGLLRMVGDALCQFFYGGLPGLGLVTSRLKVGVADVEVAKSGVL